MLLTLLYNYIKQFILNSFPNYQQTDVIYTDFEKAFDRINHELLIHKLKIIGFTDPLLSWLNSFSTKRIQFVKLKYKNFISNPILVLSGVPQGDHLSPLLFNLFTNDIVFSIKYSNILLLADDAKMFKCISNTADAELLQYDLTNFRNWGISNGMSLNINKCQLSLFLKNVI